MRFAAAALLATTVAACGRLEWPPPEYRAPGGQGEREDRRNAAAATPGGQVIRVQPGDTLTRISSRHGASIEELIRLNGLRDPDTIYAGDPLVVPEGDGRLAARTPSPAPAPAAPAGGIITETLPPPVAPAQASTSARARPTAAPTSAGANARTGAIVTRPPQPPAKAASLPAPPARSSGRFAWPVEGRVVSNYGVKGPGFRNDGINISAPKGTPIQAAENGVVVYAGNEVAGFGNLVLVRHDGGYVTAYAHADQVKVRRGEVVRRGQKIATVGTSGGVTEPQLHFEIREGVRARDPRGLLAKRT